MDESIAAAIPADELRKVPNALLLGARMVMLVALLSVMSSDG